MRIFLVVFSVVLAFNTAMKRLLAEDATIVQKGKDATALVQVNNGRTRVAGTAFCVDAAGYFVTNQHVLRTAADGAVTLVLRTGEKNQASFTATVVREDKAADLALLQIKGDGTLQSLEIASSDGLAETQELMAFGYPFGQALATAEGDTPSVSVSVGRITSLRKIQGALEMIQLDASLNPGNSGGPVVDGKGRVVGIVRGGIPGAALNFAIPSSKLTAMLSKPDLTFTAPAVAYAKRGEELELALQVTRFDHSAGGEYTVEFALGDERLSGGLRKVAAKAAGPGTFKVRVTPLPVESGPVSLSAMATFSSGSVRGTTTDQDLKVGKQTMKLSTVARIERSPVPAVVLRTGERIEGSAAGLEAVRMNVGELSWTLDLSKAASVAIDPPAPPATEVPVNISVRTKDQVVAELSSAIRLTDAPNIRGGETALGGAGIKEAPVGAELVKIKLPSTADDVIAAGGGRYLLLHLKKLRQLGVFDVNEAKIIKFLPLPADNVMIGAGLEKLVVLVPDQNVIQRWNLRTLEKELTVALNVNGQVDGLAIGCAAQGPFMLMMRNGPAIWDLDTLKPTEIKLGNMIGNWSPHPQYPLQVRASADGSTYAAWEPGLSPSGVRLLTIQGDTALVRYEHESAGELYPSADGTLLFTGGGIYTSDLKRYSDETFRGAMCFPSLDPAYFLSVQTRNVVMAARGEAQKSGVNVYTTNDKRLLFTVSDLDELTTDDNQAYNYGATVSMAKRIFLIPNAKLLVTLGRDRDELYLRHTDVVTEMDKAGIDYLFVSSMPLRLARKNQAYTYPIMALSKRGGVKFTLESGPAGMTISSDGKLSWTVPADISETQSSVIVTVSDASGQKVFHSFTIQIK